MLFTHTINDALLSALSAQFESRTPIGRDGTGVPTETAAEHVTRALADQINREVLAARRAEADAAIRAAETARDDTAWASALLARAKL